MDLDVKALGFVARALEQRIAWYEEQLGHDDATEDERSELTNDVYYLSALLNSFEQERHRLIGQQ